MPTFNGRRVDLLDGGGGVASLQLQAEQNDVQSSIEVYVNCLCTDIDMTIISAVDCFRSRLREAFSSINSTFQAGWFFFFSPHDIIVVAMRSGGLSAQDRNLSACCLLLFLRLLFRAMIYFSSTLSSLDTISCWCDYVSYSRSEAMQKLQCVRFTRPIGDDDDGILHPIQVSILPTAGPR